MTKVPEDVILEIFLLLPLKLLVRFKHLNKRLEQLISAPTFQIRRAIVRSFIGYECFLNKIVPRYELQLPCDRFLHPHMPIDSFELNCRFRADFPIILASSGGLLLLSLSAIPCPYYPSIPCHRSHSFCLFNPATGAYQIIQPTYLYKFELSGVGLVVSKNHSYFKLVFLFCCRKSSTNSQFWIYESESKSWHQTTSIDLKFLRILPKDQRAYDLNDSLYWVAIERNAFKILVFNVKSEVAEIINLPEANRDVVPRWVNLGVVRDKLFLMVGGGKREVFLWIYNFIHHTWEIDRTFYCGLDSEWEMVLPWCSLPVFCDGNQLIIEFLEVIEDACVLGIGGDSRITVVTIPLRSSLWSNFTHFLGTLIEIPDCQYLTNGLKGMKDHISDDEFQPEKHFEDLLFITKCCSFLE